MIVLNGEPFTRYSLRSIYPFASQIVVVEGACRAAASVATPNGHSRDGTLDVLRRFRDEEDPDHKLVLVTAEDDGHPDGFWPGEKHEMSQAYARRATGDWLWQVDSDEFYLTEDMERIAQELLANPKISRIDFPMRTFSAAPWLEIDGFLLKTFCVRRVFAWRPTYRMSTHRPPTVVDGDGRDVSSRNPLSARFHLRQGIYMYHYEQLFPKQVREKCAYYARAEWTRVFRDLLQWVEEGYLRCRRPYRVHMVYSRPSWVRRYRGAVPAQVSLMYAAVKQGQHPGVVARNTEDLEMLAEARWYRLGRAGLMVLFPLWLAWMKFREAAVWVKRRVLSAPRAAGKAASL
jgi:hypothetical protein